MLHISLPVHLNFETLCAYFEEVQVSLICENIIGLNTEAQSEQRVQILGAVKDAVESETYVASILSQKNTVTTIVEWEIRRMIAEELIDRFGVQHSFVQTASISICIDQENCACSSK